MEPSGNRTGAGQHLSQNQEPRKFGLSLKPKAKYILNKKCVPCVLRVYIKCWLIPLPNCLEA